MASVTGRFLLTCMFVFTVVVHDLWCEAFLLVDTCPAPAPCTCSGSGTSFANINCNYKSLNQTPHFLSSGYYFEILNIGLNSNNLVTIPNYAFRNLSSINATGITIDLENNKISTIERLAFSGIGNVTNSLYLRNNNLYSLPAAVGDLHALNTLYLSNNPLKTLGVSTLTELGHILQTLNMDSKEFSAWPAQFRHFHSLKTLNIRYLNFSHLNSDAFQSFENSLTSFSIQFAASFDKIPNAVCQLSNLQWLSLKYFTNLNEKSSTIFDHCSKNLSKLTNLEMSYNHLTKFPDVFHIFPSLSFLYLQGNSLDIIETEKIPITNILSKIDLDTNNFKRIPNSINRLKQLSSLDLRNNDIFSVEDHDLFGLNNLVTLHLMNNPIKYISSHAFRYNLKLRTLHLEGTSLVSIPAAVMSLPNLSTFDIRNTNEPIPCTCDMSYLRGWNATAVSNFYGNCANSNTNFKNFIMSSLQHCP